MSEKSRMLSASNVTLCCSILSSIKEYKQSKYSCAFFVAPCKECSSVWIQSVKSFAHRNSFVTTILTPNTEISSMGICHKCIARLTPQRLTNLTSTLVQVMVWYRQKTSHCLSQYWPRSMLSTGHNELITTHWGRSLVIQTKNSSRLTPALCD